MISDLNQKLIKKQIKFNWSGISTIFDSSQALFSSVDIDLGTRALLNSLRKNQELDLSRVLDLGCGYGPIGIFLKKQDPTREIVMTDRDLLAVKFTQHNALLNETDVTVLPALDYEGIKEKFSLIITNFPAKLEKQGLFGFIAKASRTLLAQGVFAIVVVQELCADLEDILVDLGDKVRLCYLEKKKGYTIFHLKFNDTIEGEVNYQRGTLELLNEYLQDDGRLKVLTTQGLQDDKRVKVLTARGLPEFDTLSYDTQLLISLLKGFSSAPESLYVLESGQGHGVVAAALLCKSIKEISLNSRDLLALRFSKRNLEAYFEKTIHLFPKPYLDTLPIADLLIWNVRSKNNLVVHEVNAALLKQNRKKMLFYGEASLLEYLIAKYGFKCIKKVYNKGYVALLVN